MAVQEDTIDSSFIDIKIWQKPQPPMKYPKFGGDPGNNQCSVRMLSGTVEALLVVTTSPDLTLALRERDQLSEQLVTLLPWSLITHLCYDLGQAKPFWAKSNHFHSDAFIPKVYFSPLIPSPNETLFLIEGKIDLRLNNQSFY